MNVSSILLNKQKIATLSFFARVKNNVPEQDVEGIVMDAIATAERWWIKGKGKPFYETTIEILISKCWQYHRNNSKFVCEYVDSEYFVDEKADIEREVYFREMLPIILAEINNIQNKEHHTIIVNNLIKDIGEVLSENERQIIYRFRQTLKEKYGDIFEW